MNPFLAAATTLAGIASRGGATKFKGTEYRERSVAKLWTVLPSLRSPRRVIDRAPIHRAELRTNNVDVQQSLFDLTSQAPGGVMVCLSEWDARRFPR